MSSSNPNALGAIYTAPTETFSASVDFSSWLTTNDTIASGAVTCHQDTTDVSSTMIGTVTDDNDDQVSFVIKAAGTSGTSYLITVTATTAAADVWVAKLNLFVK